MNIRGVNVINWNPRRHIGTGPIARRLPRLKRPNNFGDLIGPLVAKELAPSSAPNPAEVRLLTVGSIMHFAREGDVVWGTGVNGKTADKNYTFTQLDVRATRGPRTREWLLARGIDAPEIYGDPALLIPHIFPAFTASISRGKRGVTVVPNLHDVPRWRDAPGYLDPTTKLWKCIRAIAESSHVVASSLHGIIIAEAFGVPASLLRPGAEALFKYEDYYEGTSRALPTVSDTIEDALNNPSPPLTTWRHEPLLNAFPTDMWSGRKTGPVTA